LDINDLSRFLSLALITHKYQFTHLERWAQRFLLHYSISGFNLNIFFPRDCTQEDFPRLSRYAVISKNGVLQSVILTVILQRVDSTPRTFDLINALNLGEQNGWRILQGEIYYRILCEAAHTISNRGSTIMTSSEFQAVLPKELNDRQKSCIVQGYLNLIIASDITMGSLQETTTASMKDIAWKHLGLGPSRRVAVDLISRLQDLADLVENWRGNSIPSSHIQNMLMKVKKELPLYFLGEPERLSR
jgi:hypothetical protein